MKDYSIQQGETLRLTATVTEQGALTAELVAINGDNSIVKLSQFDGLTADLTTNTPSDQAPGDYPYYMKITWEDGSVDILTTNEDCSEGVCPMPIITVCPISQVSA